MEHTLISKTRHLGCLNLPISHPILFKLIELCRDGGEGEARLLKIIAVHPALAMETLRAARSIQGDDVRSPLCLDQAVSLLGTENLKRLAIRMLTFQNGHPRLNTDQVPTGFWHHSLLCAHMASRFAVQLGFSSSNNAYLAGLLHDVGKILYLPVTAGNHQGAPENAGDQPPDHCELGAQSVYACCGQRHVAEAIRYHHEPEERLRDAFPLVKIIRLANLLSHDINGDRARAYEAAATLFDWAPQAIDGVAASAEEETHRIAGVYGITTRPEPAQERAHLDLRMNGALAVEIERASLYAGVFDRLLQETDVQSVLGTLGDSIQIEFGLPRPVFFQHLKSKNCLAGWAWRADGRPEYDQELMLDTNKGIGLIAAAFNSRRPRHTLESPPPHTLSLADEHVRHLLGTGELLCLPVMGRQAILGVLILGFDVDQFHLSEHMLGMLIKLADSAGARLDDLLGASMPAAIEGRNERSRDLVTRKMIHEVNNPLSVIKNYLAVLKMKLAETHPVQEETEIIAEEINHIKRILSQYADVAIGADSSDQVDVNNLVTELITLMQKTLNPAPELRFETRLDSALPLFPSNRGKLKQIILNLLLNAAEAMPGGGLVRIQTRYAPFPLQASESGQPAQGGKVHIIITDNGPGLGAELKAGLFLPIDTGPADQQSGLGLSIVYSLVRELNGTITCDSSETNGTMFTIILPI